MGGFGSGRQFYWSSSTKLDEGLNLGINQLVKDGAIKRGCWITGSRRWTWTRTGEHAGSIGYESNATDPENMWIRLHYTSTIGGEEHKMDYRVKLTTTRTNYGQRLWFVCPLTGRRAAVLYSPPGSKWFASRHAFNLKYRSQSKSAHDRAIDRMWKLKNRLGGEDYYKRPKGMHKKTHERKMQEVWDAEEICDAYLARFAMGIMSRSRNLSRAKR